MTTTNNEVRTHKKPPHGSIEWLMKRHRDENGNCVLGASDAPALMQVSPFTSRADLFVNKTMQPKISETNDAMHVGNVLEPALVSELGRRLGVKMTTPDVMFQRDRFIVSLDALTERVEAPAVVGEVKTTRRHRISTLEDVPQDYLWQCWAQMLVVDRPVWLIVLDKDMSISTHEIPRNEEALDILRRDSETFCAAVDRRDEQMMSSLTEQMNVDQIAAMYRPEPVVREITPDEYNWIKELADARDLKRQAEQIEQAARDHIARFMLNAEIATLNGTKVLTWREQAGRASLDVARLRAEQPDLCAAYMKQGEPSRVMRLSNTKGNN
jgi:predicted phage-related endonuclease